MLLLMDEVFDLKSKNQWLRRRIVAVVRQIIQATSGDAINKRIVDFVEDSTSPESIARYLRRFKNNLWPSGYKAAPVDPNSRDVNTKNRTRVMAKSFLISALSDDLKHIIGSETTRKGLLCVFDMFQNKTLNRRLILVLFESIITELFPENHFPEIFQRLHCVNPKTGIAEESSKWPPHLKFMSEAAFYEDPSMMKRSSSTKSWKWKCAVFMLKIKCLLIMSCTLQSSKLLVKLIAFGVGYGDVWNRLKVRILLFYLLFLVADQLHDDHLFLVDHDVHQLLVLDE